MSSWGKFRLLFWKNYKLQSRAVVTTILEIGLPVLLAIILVVLRTLVVYEEFPEPYYWNLTTVDYSPTFEERGPWKVMYTPDVPVTRRVMQTVKERLQFGRANPYTRGRGGITRLMPFESDEAMEDFIRTENASTRTVYGGVSFTNIQDTETLPNKVTYSIRPRAEGVTTSVPGIDVNLVASSVWFTDFLVPLSEFVGPRLKWSSSGGVPAYWGEGFFQLVYEIDRAIAYEIEPNATDELWEAYNVGLERYPYPPYIMDPFILVMQRQFPFVLVMSFIITVFSVVKNLVLEKERRLKELMKLMGLTSTMYWCSWFAKYISYMLLTVVLLTILFSVPINEAPIVNATDPSLLFIFLLLYAISTLCFCCLVSVGFKKANNGALAGGVIFFFSYMPYNIFEVRYEEVSYAEKVGFGLFHNVAMAMGCKIIGLHEGTGAGLQWSNLFKGPTLEEDYTMIISLVFLVVDSILYMSLACYLDQVFPGEYGVAKPWHFIFHRSFWFPRKSGARKKSNSYDFGRTYSQESVKLNYESTGDIIEKPEGGARPGIIIKHLIKTFRTGKIANNAVDDLSLEMFEGQITALLGHNGAGKTTTISILTGFLEPTSGRVLVNGYDVTSEMDYIRKHLGLCPQQDVLFDTLTVYEHLYFFARLKGCAASTVESEVDNMIDLLQLKEKRDVWSSKLSGGMKRKLCVGIALIAGSKIVILDEPSSGVDPSARRQLWDILQSQRKDRTILLTTHFMDEADHLGDRIAIMASGKLKCCGSSLFLKKKFGVGYHMTIVKAPTCSVQELYRTISSAVPGATVESDVAAELSFVLPDNQPLEQLFTRLEEQKDALGITSYGISVTTLEEVFIKITRDDNADVDDRAVDVSAGRGQGYTNVAYTHDEAASSASSGVQNTQEDATESNGVTVQHTQQKALDLVKPPSDIKRSRLKLRQFRAMFIKRMIHSARNLLITVVQLALPLLFAILGCAILELFPEMTDPPPLVMTINEYMDRAPQNIIHTSRTLLDNTTVQPRVLEQAYVALIKDNVTTMTSVDYTGGVVCKPPSEGFNQVFCDVSDAVRDEILRIGEENLDLYNTENMISASFYDFHPWDPPSLLWGYEGRIVGFFNNQAYHTCVLALSMVTNAMVMTATAGEYRTEVTNHPLPRLSSQAVVDEAGMDILIAFIVVSTVSFGMSFLVGTFVVFVIKERVTKAKHLQIVSGVDRLTFWLSTFSWDFINYLLPSCFLIIVFAAFQIEAYTADENILYVFLVLVLYGWSILPFVYIFSFFYEVPSSGYIWTTILNVFIGTTALLVVTTLKYPEFNQEEVGNILEWIFYALLPNFAFAYSLQALFLNYNNKETCQYATDEICRLGGEANRNFSNPCCPGYCTWCLEWRDNPLAFQNPGIGRGVTFMVIQGAVFFIIVALIEQGKLKIGKKKKPSKLAQTTEDGIELKDGDVLREATLVEQQDSDVLRQQNPLLLQSIYKTYSGGMRAVRGLSLAVPQGECFGLLGINGAGKTTLFKMLTGDEKVTGGDAFVGSYSVCKDMRKVQQNLGYCPQFDALIDQMTVEEHLTMFARLRGIREAQIEESNQRLIEMLLLDDHRKKQVKNLSGGNKRKLSTALALVADLPVIFLDEPTTGMDPVASRHVWRVLHRLREAGKTILLTSHSMEECEALCTRLAVMVNGQFKCLGSPQYLKAKFSEGYGICVKFTSQPNTDQNVCIQKFQDFMQETFPSATLKDAHMGYLDYFVSDANVKLSYLFRTLEASKVEYQIEDYSVSQTTLEQVFLSFARAQLEPTVSD